MRAPRPTIALALAVQLLACDASSHAGDDAAPPSRPTPPTVTSAVSDSLRIWLEVPDRVRVGEAVPVTLHLENTSGRALELYLLGRSLTFDVVVTRADGSVVWRRLEGEIIPAVLRLEVLGVGQRLEARAQWDQRTATGESVGPGVYTLQGQVLTEAPHRLETPPVSLQVGVS